MYWRKNIAMVVAEFLGTGVLTLAILSVQRSTIGIAYFVALAAGLTVAALTYVFSDVSGGHFNPVVTLGALVTRKAKLVPSVAYIVVQLLGGWVGYLLYTYFVNASLPEISGHPTFSAALRIAVAEGVGALIFAMVWAGVAAQRLQAAWTGVGYTVGLVVASAASIGFLNPAVALGARAWMIWSWQGFWTYMVGPVVGGVVGFVLYDLLFSVNGLSWFRSNAVAASSVSSARVVSKATPKRRAAAKRK